MTNILYGEKVVLLPLSLSDTDLIVKWRNLSCVRNYFVFRDNLTKEMHEDWIQKMIDTGKVKQFIIQDAKSQKKVGSIYLRDIDYQFHSAELGVFIGEEDYRGKGFGSESIKMIVDYGFKCLNLHRIFLRVFESNKSAILCYKNAGFEIEGIARDMVYVDNQFHNMVFMSAINKSE